MSLEFTSFPDTSLLEFSLLILQSVQIALYIPVKLNLGAFFYYAPILILCYLLYHVFPFLIFLFC